MVVVSLCRWTTLGTTAYFSPSWFTVSVQVTKRDILHTTPWLRLNIMSLKITSRSGEQGKHAKRSFYLHILDSCLRCKHVCRIVSGGSSAPYQESFTALQRTPYVVLELKKKKGVYCNFNHYSSFQAIVNSSPAFPWAAHCYSLTWGCSIIKSKHHQLALKLKHQCFFLFVCFF